MKVILIKDFNKHKANEIIEVADGYAKNYLIKNGIAQPINKQTMENLNRIKQNIADDLEQQIYQATLLKQEIEKLLLTFELKSNGNVVHGSITNTAIIKELHKHDIKVPKYGLKDESYNTFGIHEVKIELHPKVIANLKIKIIEVK
ncbi:ribosomal protein L9 [Metamycoplasma cloacale]|uniref:Large ribosomal subunit protein bL9 n=1 Tax=Metamycoplasma cloacale TaxID=92401 RepID=A0A2Z4LL94_9BACT|nr:50S ribosomal protein L9 [Metamycoplasma cloacale]AWX42509.1 50S ribosomal protein L9 [Metamycoplasma cloacale]VEU79145.1 ribosomal protein L9 [Metamycoplasma cloacale]